MFLRLVDSTGHGHVAELVSPTNARSACRLIVDSSALHRSLQTSSPRSAGPLVLSSTAGSFLITLCVCCVYTDEFDLAAVSSGSSQRAVLHGLVVHIMSLLMAVPISLDAFRDFAKRLRTCAQPLSVGFWHLEAARFVMGSVSARLNGTDVSDYCLFAEALLTVVRAIIAGLLFCKGVPKHTVSVAKAKRCSVIFVVCKV